jgi:glycosyltransferase involved in cell wall biosynthesis
MQEITGSELSNYIISQKNCKFDGAAYILEAKFGRLKLSLPNNEKITGIKLFGKRISGNGKFQIKINEEVFNYNILSKISEAITVSHETSFEILRNDSIGEIAILGFEIYYEEESELAINWKSLINKCSSYNNIRLVNNKLFASTGASLSNADQISQIETNPANLTYIEDNIIKFKGACEIISLQVTGNNIKEPTPPLFPARTPPGPATPTIISDLNFKSLAKDIKNKEMKENKNYVAKLATSNYVPAVYDSSSLKSSFKTLVPPSYKLVKYINSNGKDYLAIKKDGIFSVPISSIKSNTEYIVVLNGKKISGNGKVKIGFTSINNNLEKSSVVTFDNDFSDKSIIISSEDLKSDSFKFTLTMDSECSGDILLNRILIVPNFGVSSYTNVSYNNNIVIDYKYKDLVLGDKKFVVVIPSYNNEKWCEKNIISVLNQNYDNYRVIFIDDCSSDQTFERVTNVVKQSDKQHQFTLIKNTVRKGALENLYDMIHSCEDDEIILTLDGDDWFPHAGVISRLSEIYSQEDIWMTYGQYQNYPDGGNGIAQQIPDQIIKTNAFREYTWCSSHLRTFYAFLFKNIKQEDLMYQGKFMSMTWDLAIMFPLLEMSGSRSKFLNEILYIYNLDNPINDHKVNRKLQADLDRYVRKLPKYSLLPKAAIKKPISIGLMVIATGKYSKFIQGLISSADNFFLKNYQVNYYLFTDQEQNLTSRRSVTSIPIEHKPFPFASMDRFQHFTTHADKFKNEDYLFYVDVDCLFVDIVGREILGDTVGVTHCGYLNMDGPWEDNTKSCAYLERDRYKVYFGGGFSGGKKDKYLELSRWCADKINEDVGNGIIPRFHDETMMNTYFALNEPSVILTPSYHFPQSNPNHYKKIWGNNTYRPKILLLDKNHAEIRS